MPDTYTYTAEYQIGQKVWLDGDRSIIARITGLWFEASGYKVQVEWISNGTNVSVWMPPFRIVKIKET